MRNVKTQPILVYKEIHKRLRKYAFEKNTSITKMASKIVKEFLELEDEKEDNGK